MALVTLREMLDYAAEHNFAVPAFNVNNLEQIRAIMQAADRTQSPVIIQASAGARKYAGPHFLRALMGTSCEAWPHIPVCLHQDHGASPAVCQRSIQLGFTSVMMDGSLAEDMKTPATYDYNVRVTQEVVRMAHACGVSVEGELGCLGSIEGEGAQQSARLTDPDQACDFVEATGVDALAIAIGTSHGAYKFTRPPTDQVLAIPRVKAIHERCVNVHLVMHGSSSVPQELLAEINQYGGMIPPTYGVPIEQIRSVIAHGVRKVNIDTDLRLAATAAIRRYLAENPSDFDPRKYLNASLVAMQMVCEKRFEALGAAGHAGRIRPRGLMAMVDFYSTAAAV